MKATAHARLVSLQKKIYRSLEADAKRLLGRPPAAIERYEREWRTDFRVSGGGGPRLKTVTKTELVAAMRRADVTLIGDFHPFAQAQRTALRLVREAVQPGERWAVGLELVSSQFQSELDAYVAGKLSLEAFHDAIHYDEEWGFPWRNYEPLFRWARATHAAGAAEVRFIALNRPRAFAPARNRRELDERDRWAAGIVTDLFHHDRTDGPRAEQLRVVVLYGELHVGAKHLPEQLRRISEPFLGHPLSTVTVHQNHDGLYWRLARRGLEHRTEAVSLRRGAYCVFSGAPWTKLQSLVTWAEGGEAAAAASAMEGNDDTGATEPDAQETAADYLSLMSTSASAIAEVLGLESPSFDALSVVTIDEAGELDQVIEEALLDPRLTRDERALIRYHVLHNQRLYIPRAGRHAIAYLGSPTHNGAAELAAIHLRRTRTRDAALFRRGPEAFHEVALEWSFGFLGSLMLNPRRKCDLREDHARRLRGLREGARPVYPFEREAREVALAELSGRRRPAGTTSAIALTMGARMAGQVLGKRLYHALMEGWVAPERLCELYLRPARGEERAASERYALLLGACSRAPLTPSKSETL